MTILVPARLGSLVDSSIETSGEVIHEAITWQIIVLIILSFVLTFFQLIIDSFLSERIGLEIRNDLMKKVTRQTYEFITKITPEKILTNLTSDISTIKSFFRNAINLLITSVILIIGSFVAMLSVNAKLALMIFPVFPCMLFLFFVTFGRVMKLFKKRQKKQDELNKVIDENIKASMLVRVFDSQDIERQRFDKENQRIKRLAQRIVKIISLIIPIVNATNYVAVLIILGIGGSEIISGNLQIGQLLAFYQYVTMFIGPIVAFGFIANTISQTVVSTKRIMDVLDAKVMFKDGKKQLKSFDKIEAKDLNVSLTQDLESGKKTKKQILSNLDFSLEKGEKVGIIGTTGAGKSVLIETLLRFIEPDSGEILLNNKPIKEYQINTFRQKIGFVPQINFLFQGTVRENILFGLKTSDYEDNLEEKMRKVAKIADVESFVQRFSKGYDTLVGERGVSLSGGQKQRVTLARALMTDPEILILDNATSRLDIETEKEIFNNVEKDYSNLALVIIAQKIVSVKNCDRIYVINDGEIEACGTHEELQSKSFIYQELELSQSNKADYN
jgi:ATP-binding cassette subfamily B protein